VVYLIVFNTIIAFTVQNIAQKYVPDTRTSLILSTESVFGFLFSAILLGERMQVRGVVGSVLIFGAVLFSKIDWREWKKEKL
jgi:drug/metabolite transporter (DMT)-like permease